jgi:tetratricopeptide (TPR) repeat protein
MENTPTQTLPPEVENVINAIASDINAGEAIIFCGAGISRDSGFPIVNEFVSYVLLTLCVGNEEINAIATSLKTIRDDQQQQDKIKQIIAKKMEVSQEVIDKIINSLPFEAFIEILCNNSKIDKIFKIYDAEAYEPPVEPNTNHIMLARLVATGKIRTIVTTNFDRLIEKTLEQLDKQAGLDYDVIYKEEDFEHIDWAADRCRLIKIHGTIDDKQSMAITLSQVAKQELSAARAGIIRHIFNQGSHKTVLILGYSCSDVFDLSPQIESLTENFKQIYLVQHSDKPMIQNIREQEQKNPFKAFTNSTRLFFKTSDLVKALWKATLEEPYEDHKALETTPGWNAMVQAWNVDSVHTGYECMRDVIFGRIFYSIYEWRVSIDRYKRVLAYSRRHADDLLKGLALGNMGIAYYSLGEYSKAIEFHEQHLEIARRIGDVQGEGNALGNMGNAYYSLGEYHKAIGFLEQHLEITRRIGDVQGEGNVLGNIGNVYRNLGEYRKAIGFLEQHLEITRRIGDVQGEGNALGNMGITYSNLGEYQKAIGLSEQYLEIARCIGDVQGEGNALGSIGNVYYSLGEYRKAIGFLEQHLEITRRIGDVQGEGNALGNMGNAYSNLGEYQKAIGLSEQYLEIARCIGDVQGEGNALGSIGRAYASMGDKEKAVRAFTQSKAIFTKIGLQDMVSTIDRVMKQVSL